MPIDPFAIPPFQFTRFKRPFPTNPDDFIVLSDDEDDIPVDDTSTVVSSSSTSPSKSESNSSSVQTTPSPSPAKKQMLVFGKPARPFSEDENKLIVDHLLQACNLVALQKVMDRSRTTVLRQVESILQRGLQSVTKKSK